MLYQGLNQKQLQRLSPQQIQLMKLLQIPTAALEQRIKEEIESNPALDETEKDDYKEETGTDESIEDYHVDDFLNDYMDEESSYTASSLYQNNATEDEKQSFPIAVASTFHEHIEKQLALLEMQEEEEKIIQQIVGSIDEDGYLRRDTSSIIDDLMFGNNIITGEDTVEKLIHLVQSLDPPGIGARDLRECLLIQLERKTAQENEKNYTKDCLIKAHLILTKYFEEFSKKHYNKLIKSLDIEEEELKDIIDEIVKLNPKPASSYRDERDSPTHYVVPDFIIYNNNGELELTLNSKNAPDLQVSDQYRGMLKHYKISRKEGKLSKKDREAALFIKQKIDSAKWFIDAIKKRQNTMFNTMYAILQYQKEYFLTGDEKKIKPMILKDIASLTDFDISTISRVANSKFVQTEFGTKRLKDFFSESVQNTEGEEVSTLEVKIILEEIIKSEDKKKPYSDQKLQDLLEEKGYSIARRTIAKYREQLGISVARLRKEL